MIDYILVVAIGVTANQFGATISFYKFIYPIIIGITLVVSFVVPIVSFIIYSVKQKDDSKVHNSIDFNDVFLKEIA